MARTRTEPKSYHVGLAEVRAGVAVGMARAGSVLVYVLASDKESYYEVRVGKDDTVYCTCRSWVTLNKGPKATGAPCKHLKRPDVAKVVALHRLAVSAEPVDDDEPPPWGDGRA